MKIGVTLQMMLLMIIRDAVMPLTVMFMHVAGVRAVLINTKTK